MDTNDICSRCGHWFPTTAILNGRCHGCSEADRAEKENAYRDSLMRGGNFMAKLTQSLGFTTECLTDEQLLSAVRQARADQSALHRRLAAADEAHMTEPFHPTPEMWMRDDTLDGSQ